MLSAKKIWSITKNIEAKNEGTMKEYDKEKPILNKVFPDGVGTAFAMFETVGRSKENNHEAVKTEKIQSLKCICQFKMHQRWWTKHSVVL